MKTYGSLFERVIDIDNIKLAIHNAAKHKKKLRSVQYALKHQDEVATKLHELLESGEWCPPKIHKAHTINDGVTMKKRDIICPQFIREQVVHHALLQVIAPLLQRKFYIHACGSIPNRGREYALKYIKRKICGEYKKTKYVCQIDIKKFFDSVKPSVLFHSLRKTIRDRRVLGLCAKILRGNRIVHADGRITQLGVPIGYFTSPWFTNTLLCELDHYIKEILHIPVYTRYADDLILFSSNKRKLRKAALAIKDWLEAHGLRVKHEIQVHKVSERTITFCGFVFKNKKTRLRRLVYVRATRIAKRLSKKKEITVYDARRALCYAGQFMHVDCWKAFHSRFLPFVKPRMCRIKVRYATIMQNSPSRQRT